APQFAALPVGVGRHGVHGAAVVPHHEIAHLPAVRIDELPLRRVLHQIAEEGSRLGDRPAHDAARVGGEEQRFPPRRGMRAHQALAHRREARALLVGEVGEAELLAGEDLRVLADEIVDLPLGVRVERVVRRPHVGELRVAALGRDAVAVQDRVFRGPRLERAVGVPEAVAQGEETRARVAGEHLVVRVDVGHVREGGGQTVRLPQAGADGVLDLAEAQRERELLLLGDGAAVEHQHRVLVHRGVDVLRVSRGEGSGEIEALDLRGEARADLSGGGHAGVPSGELGPPRAPTILDRSGVLRHYAGAVLLLTPGSPLHDALTGLAAASRVVVVTGLPGTGKSLLIHQLAQLAQGTGRAVSLLQWDVARPVVEGSAAARAYPARDGVAHGMVRVAVGRGARAAIAAWDSARPAEGLLIVEAPLVGHRLVELVRPMADASEALLSGPRTRFIVPVPPRAP